MSVYQFRHLTIFIVRSIPVMLRGLVRDRDKCYYYTNRPKLPHLRLMVSRYSQFFYLKTQRVLPLKSQPLLGGEEDLPA
jgi:hypothetical protein